MDNRRDARGHAAPWAGTDGAAERGDRCGTGTRRTAARPDASAAGRRPNRRGRRRPARRRRPRRGGSPSGGPA
ncbi:hypothetical protein D8M29_07215, partial [Micrococcus sp. HSID17227]